MGKIPHVGIIGAGVSALRCADILVQNGVKVTMLEARSRVGGRITQTQVAGHLIDLGPNWIHGTEHNPILEIAVRSNTVVHEWDGHQIVFDSSGRRYDDATATKMAEWLWTIIGNAFEYSNMYKDVIPSDKSLLDYIREQVEKTNFTKKEQDECIELARIWGAYVGDAVERQSLKFFRLEECVDGNNSFVASTYNNILADISAPALRYADIRLKEPVIRIEASPRTLNTTHQVIVTTMTGSQHHFDEVVVTCPLGWLKRNKAAFIPELPVRLSQAVDNISYGRLEKIYAIFPSAFWNSSPDGWNASGTQTQHPPAFIHFLKPTYVDHPENAIWDQGCVSLAALPTDCAQPTLLFYLYGPCSTYVVSKVTNLEPSSEAYYEFLNEFLLPYYSRLPCYSPSSPECKPIGLFASQWQNDPYAGNGSYSNFQVGLEHGDKDIEVMRIGMGMDRGVWFAGEHTAPFVGLGTTTGAYWSGERAASQICEAYSLGQTGMGAKRDDTLPSAERRREPKIAVTDEDGSSSCTLSDATHKMDTLTNGVL